MNQENLLMVADSEHDANLLYAAGFLTPDPVVFVRVQRQAHLLLNDLDLARARRGGPGCRLWPLSRGVRQLARDGVASPQPADLVQWFLHGLRLKKVVVPGNFPHGLAQKLRKGRFKVKVKVKKGEVFPERECKSADEVKKISAALVMAEVGLAEGLQAVRCTSVGQGGRLYYHGAVLTSEKLRSIIDVAILQAGGVACHTIAVGGTQACDPHESGHGALRTRQAIVIDIVPRSQKTGYYGGLTRTVVKGRAGEGLRRLYHTVQKAQSLAFSLLEPHLAGAMIHRAVQRHFEDCGYRTHRRNGQFEGFLNATGHGLGLDPQELPRLDSTTTDVIQPGQVIAIEPGLCYSEIGAVRLKDVAWIAGQGPRNLTKFEKVLELQ